MDYAPGLENHHFELQTGKSRVVFAIMLTVSKTRALAWSHRLMNTLCWFNRTRLRVVSVFALR